MRWIVILLSPPVVLRRTYRDSASALSRHLSLNPGPRFGDETSGDIRPQQRAVNDFAKAQRPAQGRARQETVMASNFLCFMLGGVGPLWVVAWAIYH
jgi:hypothetical protein